MSHTISARKPEGFKVEVFNYDGECVHSAWYQDRDEAQIAASSHERMIAFPAAPSIDDIFAEMSDDELLAELGL